jgi:hypothetical protein
MAYNAQGMEIMSLYQTWNNGAWETIFGNRNLITNDQNGKMKEMESQSMDSAGNWVSESKVVFTHNTNGDINGASLFTMDNGTWTEMARIVNATFANNNFDFPTSYTIQMEVPVLGWINVQRFSSTYNTNGKMLTSLSETFSPMTQQWQNSDRETYTYDSRNNQVLWVSDSWVNNAWLQTEGEKDSIVYNTNGGIDHQISQFWVDSSSSWENYEWRINSFNNTASIANASRISQYSIYPNPANEIVKIELQGLNAERVNISLVDITGRSVYNNNIVTNGGLLNTSINTADLKSGIYIMQIQSGNQVLNHKIVKE